VPQSVREQFQVLGEAARGCDLIVAGTLVTAARSVAESLQVPYVHVVYCPVTLPSFDHPPPMIRRQSLPRLVNRFLWFANQRSWNRTFGATVNEQRARLGLSAVKNVSRHVLTARPWVAADPALAPAGSPAGMEVIQTGAWLLPDPTPLPADLEKFLGEGEPPVYFGLGSMGVPGEKGRLFLDAARALGRRAIISQGWASPGLTDTGKDSIVIGDVSHDQLLPRVAVMVHHGGAGTTTAAARAGRPQVVVPNLFDQHYWAHRVGVLGIGVSGPPFRRLTLEGLTGALREALQPGKAAAALALAGRMELRGARLAAERLMKDLGEGLLQPGSGRLPS